MRMRILEILAGTTAQENIDKAEALFSQASTIYTQYHFLLSGVQHFAHNVDMLGVADQDHILAYFGVSTERYRSVLPIMHHHWNIADLLQHEYISIAESIVDTVISPPVPSQESSQHFATVDVAVTITRLAIENMAIHDAYSGFAGTFFIMDAMMLTIKSICTIYLFLIEHLMGLEPHKRSQLFELLHLSPSTTTATHKFITWYAELDQTDPEVHHHAAVG